MIRRSLMAAALFFGLGFGVQPVVGADTAPSLLLRVVDRAGRPVAGATVRAAWGSPEEDAEHTLRETTSPRGTVRLTGLPAEETFWMSIEKAGFTSEIRSASATTDGPREIRVTLAPGSLAVGRVVDEEGRPVAGAEVELSGSLGPAVLSTRRARSGPAGRFRFRDLPAEELELTIRHDEYATLAADHRIEGGTPGRLGTFVLRRGATLRGTVTDAAGRPVAGARVWALTGQEFSVDAPAAAVTAADGTFLVPHRPPGEELSLWVCADGFLQVADTVLFSNEPVGVTLERAAAVQGRVLDPDGAPQPGATVDAEAYQNGPVWERDWAPCPTEQSVTADAQGRFAFQRLGPDWYELRASAPGSLEGVVEGIRLDAGMAGEEQEIRLGRLEADEGETADAVPEPKEDEDAIEVHGRILGPDGSPVEGALVSVAEQSVSSERDGAFAIRCGCRSDEPQEIVAEKCGFARGRTTVLLASDRVQDVEVRLEAGAQISGRVLGLAGGDLPGVETYVTDGETVRGEARVDAEGRFRLSPIPAGTWEVQARSGYRFAKAPVILEPGQTEASVELSFAPVQEVSGRVLDPDGLPAAHASVSASHPPEEHLGDTFTHVDGTFSLRVPAGELSLVAEHHGLRRLESLQIGDDPVTGVEIQLERGAVLSGRVLGLPPDDDLPLITLNGPLYEIAHADPDGSWSAQGIGSGTWKLEAVLFLEDGVQVIRRTLEISQETPEITLDLDFTGLPVTDPDTAGIYSSPPQ
ncbi:MAG TPA: carboxypeptidase-like regulatory domain-containing protein [Thermoanaerobaculia bacterium]|nr:carboxypeptidase-like regulatory domain-containing protein [Thermoanaerobaculia bacterium]